MANPPPRAPGSGPPPGAEPPGSAPVPAPQGPRRSFRATLVRVMLVQIVTLALLWLMQATYNVSPG